MKIIKTIEKILKEAQIEEYKKEAQILVSEISALSLEEILLGKEIKNKDKIIEMAKKRARTKMPIQHILGYSYFMGKKYIVNKDVLIPRDETELLVKKAYELLENKKEKLDILEIGTGSGCISCALADLLKNYNVEILAVDISSSALIAALENINKLDLIRKVIIRKSDIFSKIRAEEKFDLIISNPPYIPICKKDELQFEVKNFDPDIALFAPDEDGVWFYKKIIKDAKNFLKPDGYLLFELGINQRNKVEKILEKDFKDIDYQKDLSGIERIIWARTK